jgi:molybdopterin converting factor small subunit
VNNSFTEPTSQRFTLLLFASLRDAAGHDFIEVLVAPREPHVEEFSQHPVTVEQLLTACVEQYPGLARWKDYVKVAVNCDYSSLDQIVLPTDEIALIPPVSGG